MAIEHVDGDMNPADLMTKQLGLQKIEQFCEMIGLVDVTEGAATSEEVSDCVRFSTEELTSSSENTVGSCRGRRKMHREMNPEVVLRVELEPNRKIGS